MLANVGVKYFETQRMENNKLEKTLISEGKSIEDFKSNDVY